MAADIHKQLGDIDEVIVLFVHLKLKPIHANTLVNKK